MLLGIGGQTLAFFRGGGAAQLTELGIEVVSRYRRMELLAQKAVRGEVRPVMAWANRPMLPRT